MGCYQGIQRSDRLPLGLQYLPVCFHRPLIQVGYDQGNQEKEMQGWVLYGDLPVSRASDEKHRSHLAAVSLLWRGQDSNLRPPGYELES